MRFLRRVARLSLRERVRSSDICRKLRIEPLIKEPAELVQASDQDTPRTPPLRGVLACLSR